MSGASGFSGKFSDLRGILEHLIVIGLVALGSVLATTMAPEETALQYELQTHSVAGTSVAHLKLLNSTKRTLLIEVQAPAPHPIRFATSLPTGLKPGAERTSWVGRLTPDQRLSVLMVIEGDLPEALVSKLVKAKLPLVDDSSGTLVERQVEVREYSTLSVARSVRYAAWFLAPLLLAGALFIVWVYVRRRRSGSASGA